MHSLKNSLSKRIYAMRLTSAGCAKVWKNQYWHEHSGVRLVSCSRCPKLSSDRSRCSIPHGSPIRKCVSAAQEAHLHSLDDKNLLEIGFGKHSIARQLVTDAGGSWTGIEPTLPRSRKAALGKGGFGHVAAIPFPDNTFDIVVGVQTLEHWEESLPDPGLVTDYAASFNEIFRVLRPNGSIYFDAPIYLHGHEMFIAGDIDRIRGLFDPALWRDVRIEKWRENHAPLERYATPESDARTWEQAVTSYPPALLADIRNERSVCLIAISAITTKEFRVSHDCFVGMPLSA